MIADQTNNTPMNPPIIYANMVSTHVTILTWKSPPSLIRTPKVTAGLKLDPQTGERNRMYINIPKATPAA